MDCYVALTCRSFMTAPLNENAEASRMVDRQRVQLVVAFCAAVLIVGGVLAYRSSNNQAGAVWGRATTLRAVPGVTLGSGACVFD